jgi:hypothetical protein
VLAMPEKSEYIIAALLGPLAAPQKSALVAAAEHGSIKGWAGSYGNAGATTAPGKSGWPLVCDLRKSKDIPRARWADELDFCTCSCVDYELYHFTRCALYYLSCGDRIFFVKAIFSLLLMGFFYKKLYRSMLV